MSFSSLVSNLDSILLDMFGRKDSTGSPIPITIHFKDGYLDLTSTFIVKNPTFEEDYVPGSSASIGQGVSVLIAFVHLTSAQIASSRLPVEGDTASVADVDYDIFRVGADREDGRTLYMRRRNQRWDQ